MEGLESGLFSASEKEFVEMLDKGGVLVGDKWFPADSSKVERTKYLLSFYKREERNRRRRERYRETHGPARPRNVRGFIGIDDESQRKHRPALERRKCQRRATIARCPTANEIRAAWKFRNESVVSRLRLGGLLLDLECYVDNALKRIFVNNRWLITGRSAGIKGWIKENCPELVKKYGSLIRIKDYAKNLRQGFDLQDPVPTSVLIDPKPIDIPTLAALSDRPLQIQPRGPENTDAGTVTDRFVWEHSPIQIDAQGREYRGNKNYWLIANTPDHIRDTAGDIATARERFHLLRFIRHGKRTIESYMLGLGRVPSRPVCFGAGLLSGAAAGGGGGLTEKERERWGYLPLKGVFREIVEEMIRLHQLDVRRYWLFERKKTAGEIIRDAFVAWMEIPYVLKYGPRFRLSDYDDEW